MLARLRAKSGLRTFFAIAAAYVFVAQTVLASLLLPPMTIAAAVAGDLQVICHSDGGTTADETSPQPSGLPQHATCAVCVQAQATAGADAARAPLPILNIVYVLARAEMPAVPTAQRLHDPRSSQGPPRQA